jgi:hypothetical protein
MLAVILKRYVIFRRGTQPMEFAGSDPTAAADGVDMRVSGVFRLNEKLRQRFLSVPAVFAEMESGDKGLLANIDASVKLYEAATENRAGVWGIIIKSGTPEPPVYGTHYVGWTARPAMRIRFTDAATGKRAVAVLNFATSQARESAAAMLYGTRDPGVRASTRVN